MVKVEWLKFSPEFAAVVSEGVFKPSVFYLADGGDTSAEFAAHVRTLPRFELAPGDVAVPEGLEDLPPDAQVIYRLGELDELALAGELVCSFRSDLARRAGGHYTVNEAAEMLTGTFGVRQGFRWTFRDIKAELVHACLAGDLRFFDKGEPFQFSTNADLVNFYKDSGLFGGYGETVTPEDIDAWLKAKGFAARFPRGSPKALGTQADGNVVVRTAVPVLEAQQKLILEKIASLGLDARKLPKPRAGKRGLKAEIRTALMGVPELNSARKFDKAWERLRAAGEIRDASPKLGEGGLLQGDT